MPNVEIIIHCPELAQLAAALSPRFSAEVAASPAPAIATAPTAAMPATPPPVPTAPFFNGQAQAAAPATITPVFTPAIPAAAPVTPTPAFTPAIPATAPTAAPAYTMDQIAKAGAELAQAGKMPQLMSLLQQHGVQAVTQLRPDQYGDFANALRGLGAQL